MARALLKSEPSFSYLVLTAPENNVGPRKLQSAIALQASFLCVQILIYG